MKQLAPVLTAALALALVSCSSDDNGDAEGSAADPCEAAFQSAAGVSDMQDTQSDLWPAFRACETLDEFSHASDKFPAALDGADPEIYVTNQCETEPELEDAALCNDRTNP